MTEIILEDTLMVWQPWQDYGKRHTVDRGMSTDGRIVGVKIWDAPTRIVEW